MALRLPIPNPSTLPQVRTNLEYLKEQLQLVETGGASADVTELEAEVQALQTQVNVIASSITQLTTDLDTLETEFDNLNPTVTNNYTTNEYNVQGVADGDVWYGDSFTGTMTWDESNWAMELSVLDMTPVYIQDYSSYAFDDVLMLESSLSAPSTGTAPSRVLYNGPGNSGDWSLWSFPYNATRYLQSAVQLPHGYKADTSLWFHVHFIPDAAMSNGDTVIFKAEVTYGSVYADMSSEQTYTSTYTADGTETADTHCMTVPVEIAPSALAGSGFVLARIYRDTADTSGANVFLLGADYHIQKNRLGSAEQNPTT